MWSRKQNKNKKFYLLWSNKRDSSHSTLPLFSLARPPFLPTFSSPLSYHTSYLLQWWNQIVTTSPITSWQIDGETMETVTDFIFLGSKITEYGDCSYEIKKCLLLGRKAMTNLDRVLKSRDITLPTKVRLVKAMAFPVVMYRCESWTIKKAECQRTDAFHLLSNHLSSSIKTSTYFSISVHKNYSSLSVYPVSLSLSITIVILDHTIL